ncbi:MAG: hypothetical protein MGG11_11515 [Trichodesmium sp. MAG_R03]|nr:hypothetical protein [Trichodesmium sp. MAG_R03]
MSILTSLIQGNQSNWPKIGKVELIQDRPLPDGFQIKTITISNRSIQ